MCAYRRILLDLMAEFCEYSVMHLTYADLEMLYTLGFALVLLVAGILAVVDVIKGRDK